MSVKTVEKLLKRSGGSVYRLVRMASKRALELSEGRKCLVETPKTDKVTTLALEEIAQGKVEFGNGSKAGKAKEINATVESAEKQEIEA